MDSGKAPGGFDDYGDDFGYGSEDGMTAAQMQELQDVVNQNKQKMAEVERPEGQIELIRNSAQTAKKNSMTLKTSLEKLEGDDIGLVIKRKTKK